MALNLLSLACKLYLKAVGDIFRRRVTFLWRSG